MNVNEIHYCINISNKFEHQLLF